MAFLLSPARACLARRTLFRPQSFRHASSVVESPQDGHRTKSIKDLISTAVPIPVQVYRRRRILQPFEKPISAVDTCKDPIGEITKAQLSVLDPTSIRTRLFSKKEKDGIHVGDILLVRFKSGEPFSGVLLAIKRKGIDTSIMLRNKLTRISVEMQCKIYSPNITSIEIVRRREKRARRAKLYYMRDPKHDMGSVEGIVNEYLRKRMALGSTQTQGSKVRGRARKGGR